MKSIPSFWVDSAARIDVAANKVCPRPCLLPCWAAGSSQRTPCCAPHLAPHPRTPLIRHLCLACLPRRCPGDPQAGARRARGD